MDDFVKIRKVDNFIPEGWKIIKSTKRTNLLLSPLSGWLKIHKVDDFILEVDEY